MGSVWLADDEALGRQAALKAIEVPQGVGEEERAERIARARVEAEHAARLSHHPHVASVLDVIEHDGLPWIVMEYVTGAADLESVVRELGPLPDQEVARIGAAVLKALTAGHRIDILHRDVKPANILLAPDESGSPRGRITLTDYGISLRPSAGLPRLTQGIIGTPGFLAPERVRGAEPSAASDLFSLGVTLYFAATGRRPFDAADPAAAFAAPVFQEPEPPTTAGPALAAVIMGLLEKDPLRRLAASRAEPVLTAVAAGQAPAVVGLDPSGDTVRLNGLALPERPQYQPGGGRVPTLLDVQGRRQRRRPLVLSLAAVVSAGVITAAAILLPGIGGDGNGGDSGTGSAEDIGSGSSASGPGRAVDIGTVADSTGPAAEVPGARKGGTVQVLEPQPIAHLDPGRSFTYAEQTTQTLISRTLTTYRTQGESGRLTLVGDLATDAGKVSDGGRTWTYTLKEGVKFEDGSAITSKDVRHGIERRYALTSDSGSAYLQTWLSGSGYHNVLPDGPYKGKHLPDSVLETPDDRTIVFHFDRPRGELPFVLALPTSAPVPADKDTKKAYDKAPVASGPYKVKDYRPGKSLELVRNEAWDPRTDAVRHQYVDGFQVRYGEDPKKITSRLLADGTDRRSMTWSNSISADQAPDVLKDKEAMDRSLNQTQPGLFAATINTDRITDKRVREAIARAFPSGRYLQAYGGETQGEVTGSLFSPPIQGYQNSDPFRKKTHPAGEPEKARALLKEAGALGKEIAYAYSDLDMNKAGAPAVKTALEKAGFKVTLHEIESDSYYSTIGELDNEFDLYVTGWSSEWPSGSQTVPQLFHSSSVFAGGVNYSHLESVEVDDRIAEAEKAPGLVESTDAWAKLGRQILTEQIPQVPILCPRLFTLWGSDVAGVKYHAVHGNVDPTGVYLK
ncbi:protein kinase [Streptomyces tuirus]|uniref:Protein kinase n=1 Tax=Streptomyces tuirus TaxID=68278 RepID=A0A941J2C0_9ACTN|nr:protein kinase [Streptomyces tuirus]